LDYKDEGFRPKLISKYTTRPPRDDDHGEVIYKNTIPSQCDLRYLHSGYEYGLELQTLHDALDSGYSPIVILNDIDKVEQVRQTFGDIVRSIFIFRESPSLQQYRHLAESRGVTDEEEPVRRFLEAQKFYHIYHENINTFNHVILNIGTPDDRDEQAKQIVDNLEQKLRHNLCKTTNDKLIPPRLLITVAGPAIEEERLRLAIESLDPALALYILWKRQGGRYNDALPSERPICGTNEVIFENPESTYGIRSSEIWDGLRRRVFQVVSANNIDTADHFRRIFGELVVLVYIHSEPESQEPKTRERQRLTFRLYLDNLAAFDHVLIDSGDKEDISSQMCHLLLGYSDGKIGAAISKNLQQKLAMKPKPAQIIGGEKSTSTTSDSGNRK
jgi:hypothetical protein